MAIKVFSNVKCSKAIKILNALVFPSVNFFVQKQLTTLFEKRTLLISRSATLTVTDSQSFSFNIIFQCKISTANITIHATMCNHFRFHVEALNK